MDDKKLKNYNCEFCNKKFTTRQNLWKHTHKFHIDELNKKHSVDDEKITSTNEHTNNELLDKKSKEIICEYCGHEFARKYNLKNHYLICKKKLNDQPNLLKKIEDLSNELTQIKKQMGNQPNKITNIGKQNNNNVSNGNIVNGNIIHNTFIKFGKLEYEKIFTEADICRILNNRMLSLEEGIKSVHFNPKKPEYGNIFITNMRDDLAYIFDGKHFISVSKNEMLNELVGIHIDEINLSFEKLKDKINTSYVKRLEVFLEMLNDDDKEYYDEDNNKSYQNYRAYKINKVKNLVYDNSDAKKLMQLNKMELKSLEPSGKSTNKSVLLKPKDEKPVATKPKETNNEIEL
jgi:hypothetical protein